MQKTMSAVSIESIRIAATRATPNVERLIILVSLSVLVAACARNPMLNLMCWDFVYLFSLLCANGIDYGELNR